MSDGISKEALALKKAFVKFKKELGGEVNDSPSGNIRKNKTGNCIHK